MPIYFLFIRYQHGETYVLDDGGETDLDLGNYERFLNINLTSKHSLTSGKVFKSIYDKERRGDYLGQTVQMVPHVTDFIQEYINDTALIPVDDAQNIPDVCIVEIGGTVGDHEGNIYYEALSDFSRKNSCCFVHVSLVPVIGHNEIKTKPTQHSMKAIRSLGISPNMLMLRCKRMLSDSELEKVSKFCKIPKSNVIINNDVSSIYEVPKLFMHQSIMERMRIILGLSKWPNEIPNLKEYNKILKHLSSDLPELTVGIVGKYTQLQDTYLSLIRALEHASFNVKKKLVIKWIDSELPQDKMRESISFVDGVILPGGFGVRGIEGMIYTAQCCRIVDIPLLGLCLGMQIMCIELDRNLLDHIDATSEEFSKNSMWYTVVLSDAKTQMGGTMRLGRFSCVLKEGSFTRKLYKSDVTNERHRHRYEISKRFLDELSNSTQSDIIMSGMDSSNRYAEIIESKSHKFYVGCQFHPEFNSGHHTPHPLFIGFLKAMSNVNK